MLNQLFEMFRQLFTLTEATQRNQAAITALQKDLHELSQRVDEGQRRCEVAIERLAFEVQRLRDELRHATRHEADEREKLQLKIENKLLKLGRQLPPSSDSEDEENDS